MTEITLTKVCPRERFLDPPGPPINFVHYNFQQNQYIYRIRLGYVRTLSGSSAAYRTGQGVERSEQDRPQGAERCGQDRVGGRALRTGQARGPSAAARTCQGAGRCGHMTNFLYVLNKRYVYTIVRKGGGPEIVLQEITINYLITDLYSLGGL